MTGVRVWVAARDAGAGNILLPVIRNLKNRTGVSVRVLAEGPALGVLRQGGIHAEEVPSSADQRRQLLRRLWQDSAPQALLLGTSWGGSVDKDLLAVGEENGIPSLSVVDHWSKYRERFVEQDSGRLRLPTRISVMDEIALEQAVRDGLPREILTVAGQPHLQSVAAARSDPTLLQRAQQLRARWLGQAHVIPSPGGARDPALILFGSELFSDDFHRGTPYDLGYTETDALEGLAEALAIAQPRLARLLRLVVKLHPKEDRCRFRPGPLAQARGFHLAQEQPPLECLLAADAVVGMTSMFLVEAALMGRPAVSFQPDKGRAAWFIGAQAGLVRTARTPEALAAQLAECLTGAVPASGSGLEFLRRLLAGDAAARIADLLMELRQEVVR